MQQVRLLPMASVECQLNSANQRAPSLSPTTSHRKYSDSSMQLNTSELCGVSSQRTNMTLQRTMDLEKREGEATLIVSMSPAWQVRATDGQCLERTYSSSSVKKIVISTCHLVNCQTLNEEKIKDGGGFFGTSLRLIFLSSCIDSYPATFPPTVSTTNILARVRS